MRKWKDVKSPRHPGWHPEESHLIDWNKITNKQAPVVSTPRACCHRSLSFRLWSPYNWKDRNYWNKKKEALLKDATHHLGYNWSNNPIIRDSGTLTTRPCHTNKDDDDMYVYMWVKNSRCKAICSLSASRMLSIRSISRFGFDWVVQNITKITKLILENTQLPPHIV